MSSNKSNVISRANSRIDEILRRQEAKGSTSSSKLTKRQNVESLPDAGAGWFNMKGVANIDPDLKRDLHVLRLRNVLDPKRHYRSMGSTKKSANPKVFQVGYTVPTVFNRDESSGLFSTLLKDDTYKSNVKKRVNRIKELKHQGKRKEK